MRQNPDNSPAEKRTEPLWSVHVVLDKSVDPTPMPISYKLRRGVRLVDLYSKHKGDVGRRFPFVRRALEKWIQSRARLYRTSWINVQVCIVTTIVPENKIPKKVSTENVVRVGVVDPDEIGHLAECVSDK